MLLKANPEKRKFKLRTDEELYIFDCYIFDLKQNLYIKSNIIVVEDKTILLHLENIKNALVLQKNHDKKTLKQKTININLAKILIENSIQIVEESDLVEL
jgi:hypothetical protein